MRKRFSVFAWIALSTIAMVGTATSSIAWFQNAVEVSPTNVKGSIQGSYFAGGDGTEEHPYEIHDPIHLYNLAWLQYLGYFNVIEEGTLTSQTYFTVTADLDMTGWELPPIGTEQWPFLGSFDGASHTISNLKTSNDLTGGMNTPQVFSGYTVEHPQPEIVGFFGVVGEYSGSCAYDTSENEMKNVTLNSITVESKTSQTLIGLAAGYVNGSLSGVTVGGESKIDVNEQASTALGNGITKLSDYCLVGYATSNCKDNYFGYQQDLSEFYNSAEDSSTGSTGQGNNWGGSIAFDSFNQRLHYQIVNGSSVRYKNGDTVNPNGLIKTFANSSSALTVHRGGKATTAETYLSNDPATNYIVYNMIGSGEHKIDSSAKAYTAETSVSGTYEPLLVNSDYSTADKNTGYLASSNYPYGPGHNNGVDGTIRSASYPNGQIANSIDDTFHDLSSLFNSSTGGPKYTYSGSKLEILTNSSAIYSESNYRLISDDYNSGHPVTNSALTGYSKIRYDTLGLVRYKDARTHLETVLSNSQYIHGIHFMGVTVNKNNTVSVPNAVINETPKTSYPVLLNSIDFNVKEAGYITLFAGAYYPTSSSTKADSFFDLYKVTRDASDQITNAQKIYKIYKNNSDGSYTYTTTANQTVSNASLMFDMSYLTNPPPKNNVVYYFEIPVGAGEFAITAVSGQTAGAYLMYLDIGTSASETAQGTVTAYAVTSKTPVFKYPRGVDFNPVDVAGTGGETICVSIDSLKRGILTFNILSNQIVIADASSISAYSFQGSKYYYTSGNPPDGTFKVTGNSPGALNMPPSSGTRVLTIAYTPAQGSASSAVITDYLDSNGSFNEADSTFVLNNSSSTKSAILALSPIIGSKFSDLRSLPIAATLTRISGINSFITTYDVENCDYENKIVDVDITMNSTVILTSVTSGYTLRVDGNSAPSIIAPS